MSGKNIIRADWHAEQLHGGTVGNVQLITGAAETDGGEKVPYKLVLKIQHKWERYADPDSWRREYDLYKSELSGLFSGSLRWAECYHAEMNGSNDETQIWMEYISGVSGLNMTFEMYERACYELGRFQGRLYAEQPEILKSLTNVSGVGALKNYYLRYRSWNEVYDYIRAGDCEIPRHLCNMIIDADNNADDIFKRIEKFPVVFCQRDFWETNIFYSDGEIILIDWDSSGWGYIGEDIAQVIADRDNINYMAEYYQKCIPAYYKGFAEYADISHISDNYIHEMIIFMVGYRLVEYYKFAESPEYKSLPLDTLQKIYEMKNIK